MIEIYTDGASRGNPGRGGWGVAIFSEGNLTRQMCSGANAVTNNQMELKAAIEGARLALMLQQSQGSMPVVIFSDSTYVTKGIVEWVPGWKRRGWKKSTPGPLLNLDLWKELDALNMQLRSVEWRWIKGHNGHYGNEAADALANRGADGETIV